MSESRTPETNPNEEKLEAASLTETSTAVRKLDNFWYHYKWTVLVVAFFVVVGVICLVQLIGRPKYDTSIVVATHYRMSGTEYTDFEAALENILPSDFDENGEKSINVVVYQYYSEKEIAAEEERLEAESDRFAINPQYNKSEYDAFNSYTLTGETSVYIVSPALYKRLSEGERLLPLSELYPDGKLPQGARSDGMGIDLKDTDLYRFNPAFSVLPDTAVLCLHRPTIGGNSRNKKVYEQEKTFFRALADFAVEAEG